MENTIVTKENLKEYVEKRKEEMIKEEAEKLFLLYSESMVAQGVDYCRHFENLNSKSRNAWLHIGKTIVEKSSWLSACKYAIQKHVES